MFMTTFGVHEVSACNLSTINMTSAVDNGDGTWTYTFDIEIEIGGFDPSFLGTYFVFQPASRSVLSAGTTPSLNDGSGELAELMLGSDIGTNINSSEASYYKSHLSDEGLVGLSNVASYEYKAAGTFDYFSLNGTKSWTLSITLDGCASEVLWDPSWTKNAASNTTVCHHNLIIDPDCSDIPNCSANDVVEQLCIPAGGSSEIILEDYDDQVSTTGTIIWRDSNSNIVTGSQTISENTVFTAELNDNGCTDNSTFTITTNNNPVVFNGVYPECASDDVEASFDLTLQSGLITFDAGASVSWYLDDQFVTAASPEAAFMSSGQTVYAQVVSAQGCTSTANMQLVVNAVNSSNNALAACDQGGGQGSFDLASLESVITSTAGATVSWVSNTTSMDPIASDPYIGGSGSVYAVVEHPNDPTCTSEAEVVLTLGSIEANDAEDDFCVDSGEPISINLEDYNSNVTTGGTVVWENAQGVVVSGSQILTNSQIYTATVTSGSCNASADLTINLNENPTVYNGVYPACAASDGTAEFDLTLQNSLITFENDVTVTWFEDQDMTAQATPEDAYITTATIVYGQVLDSEGCYSLSELSLEPSPLVADDVEITACDNGDGQATFDLRSLNQEVTNGRPYIVSWHTDSVNQFPVSEDAYISGPGYVYAKVVNPSVGGCETWAEITLNVGTLVANDYNTSVCDDGTGQITVDLTQYLSDITDGSNAVAFYRNSDLTDEVTGNDLTDFVLGSSGVVLYPEVQAANCSASSILTVNVQSAPTIYNGVYPNCNEGNSQSTFDLTLQEMTMTLGQAFDDNGFWSTDEAGLNVIDSEDENAYVSGNATVFFHVSSNGCFSNGELTLTVSDLVANDITLQSCDNGDGTGTYDLLSAQNQVDEGNGYDFTWSTDPTFSNSIDATTLSNYVGAPGVIYTLVNEGACNNAAQVTLEVGPVIAYDATLDGCGSGTLGVFDLTLASSDVLGGSGNAVAFYEDVTDSELSGSELTAYSGENGDVIFAIVSDQNGCSDTAQVLLNTENPPMVNGITITGCDYSDNDQAIFDINSRLSEISNASNIQVFIAPTMQPSEEIFDLDEFVSGSTTLYVMATEGACTNNGIVSLRVDDAPLANAISIEACDEDLDGRAIFDLTGHDSDINNVAGMQFTWLDDDSENVTGTPFYQSTEGSLDVMVLNPSNGCSTTVAVNLVLNQSVPQVEFTGNCVNDSTIFSFQSSGEISFAEWNFGDGEISNEPTVTHSFNNEGVRIVTLEVVSGICNYSVETEVEIGSFSVSAMEDQTIFEGESITLSTNHSDDGSIQHSWTGPYLGLSNDSEPSVTPEIDNAEIEVTYEVTVTNGLGCTASDEVVITLDGLKVSDAATAFTPNGDGENDVFYMHGNGICSLEFNIYNRWGDVVFQTQSPSDGWDGTHNGQEQPNDAYAYTANVRYCDGSSESKKGYITLIR